MKVAVMGYSGSGKSTLAKYISQTKQIPVLYLDTVQFEADWKERDRIQAVALVSEFMKNEDWVIDGNYAKFLREERLEQADCIIYMDFSRLSCLFRATKRYFQCRNTVRESMAAGCKEKMDLEFIWWILYKGRDRKRREDHQQILDRYCEKVIVIKNQRELDRFMSVKRFNHKTE